MLMGRERFSDRIVGLFGHRQVSLTTRTMQEIGADQPLPGDVRGGQLRFRAGHRVGLSLIGTPLRCSGVAWRRCCGSSPMSGRRWHSFCRWCFPFAHFPGWAKPLEVVALFAIVEAVLTSFLEPVIYGKTTGISALGLLVAAMFWTWLWGTLGLLLSTPLTVCLAVLGKYVPSMWFFAALLKDEAELEPEVRFYQRLVALDREGAVAVVEAALKQRPRVEVFDEILVPALNAGRT